MGEKLCTPLERLRALLAAIVLWWYEGFNGTPIWSPIMPRDASLSDSYMFDGCFFFQSAPRRVWLESGTCEGTNFQFRHLWISKYMYHKFGCIINLRRNYSARFFRSNFSILFKFCNLLKSYYSFFKTPDRHSFPWIFCGEYFAIDIFIINLCINYSSGFFRLTFSIIFDFYNLLESFSWFFIFQKSTSATLGYSVDRDVRLFCRCSEGIPYIAEKFNASFWNYFMKV